MKGWLSWIPGLRADADPTRRRRRKAPSEDSDFWYGEPGQVASSGVAVNQRSAMAVSAVFGCVRVIAETLSTLPVKFYRKLPNGDREEVPDHPIAYLFNQRSNDTQDPMSFLEQQTGIAALRGTGYALKIPGPRSGYADKLEPWDPDKVQVQRLSNGRVRYLYTPPGSAVAIPYSQDQVLRIPGFGFDGATGISVLQYARETIGLALAMEGFGARVFTQAALHAGVLQHPGRLDDEAVKRLMDSWRKMHAGLRNAHTVAVLEEGMKWQQVGMTAEDAQFLLSRKFQITEVCRWFRVPPHLVFDLERSTNNNIEHQGLEFVKFTMLPWARRWEWAIKRDLLPTLEEGGDNVYPEFLFDALERADLATRYNAHRTGIEGGFLKANEARGKENLPPDPNGNTLRTSLATAPAGGAPGGGGRPGAPPAAEEPEEEQPTARGVSTRALALARAVSAELVGLEVEAAKGWQAKAGTNGGWKPAAEAWYRDHATVITARLALHAHLAVAYCRGAQALLALEGLGSSEAHRDLKVGLLAELATMEAPDRPITAAELALMLRTREPTIRLTMPRGADAGQRRTLVVDLSEPPAPPPPAPRTVTFLRDGDGAVTGARVEG